MSLIHIQQGDGEPATYEETEVPGMLARQELTLEMYFWKEGMTDWRPLAELMSSTETSFVPARRSADSISEWEARVKASAGDPVSEAVQPIQPVVAPVPSAANEGGVIRKRKRFGRYYFRYNPFPLTVCLQVLLVGSIGAMALFLYQCLDTLNGGSSVAAPMDRLLAEVNGQVDNGSGGVVSAGAASMFKFFWVLFAVEAVTGILFMLWVFIANKNSRGFASNMIYTPRWAVACFFIPIVNLFQPYQVVQEIWKIAENPVGWMGRRHSLFVGFWFLTVLSMPVFSLGAFWSAYSNSSDDPHVLEMGRVVDMATVEGDIFVAALTSLILISMVAWRQAKWVKWSQQRE